MQVRRRPRGTRVAPVRVAWEIERVRKERFELLARRAGVSASVFLELVIDHLEGELTDRGVPEWMPQPEPNEGELPIDTA